LREGFVASGVKHSNRKFALLFDWPFSKVQIEPTQYFARIAASPLWVFSERITFYPSGVEPKGSGTTAYAWFVWDKDAPSRTELKWFKPYKAKFS